MKTKLLLSALLFSATSFAQATLKNSEAINGQTNIQNNQGGSQVNSSANASSATSIHSNAVTHAGDKSAAEIKKDKEAIAAGKQTVTTEAKTKAQEAKDMASQDRTVSASIHSDSKANATAEDNNLSGNASLNGSGTLSSKGIKNSGKEIKNEGKAITKTNVDAAIENGNKAKAGVNKTATQSAHKINTASSTTVHSGAGAVQAIQAKPVSIKTGTQITKNVGVKIR